MFDKSFFLGCASLVGTVIGAGVFAIPFLFSRSGVLSCLFYFFVLGTIVIFLHLFLGEVVLRTKGEHRLVGYTKEYLGKKAMAFVALSTIIGTIGSLLAYIILAGIFLNIVFPSFLNQIQYSLIAWALMSFFVFWGIRMIAPLEFFMNIGFVVIILLLFFLSFPLVKASNLVFFDKKYLFLPFGPLFFSMVGWNAVPAIASLLKSKKNLKDVIFFSLIFVFLFYILFGLIVSGVSGELTTEDAFSGLVPFLGKKAMILGGIFGLFSIITSFLILANYLKNTLFWDLGASKTIAFSFSVFMPLFLFLGGMREFVLVIGIVGTLVGLIEGTIIVLLYKKAKEKSQRAPEFNLAVSQIFLYLIPFFLFLGTVFQLYYYFEKV